MIQLIERVTNCSETWSVESINFTNYPANMSEIRHCSYVTDLKQENNLNLLEISAIEIHYNLLMTCRIQSYEFMIVYCTQK